MQNLFETLKVSQKLALKMRVLLLAVKKIVSSANQRKKKLSENFKCVYVRIVLTVTRLQK
jgi:hypothetical protein